MTVSFNPESASPQERQDYLFALRRRMLDPTLEKPTQEELKIAYAITRQQRATSAPPRASAKAKPVERDELDRLLDG